MKTHSQSEDNKLLASGAFVVTELRHDRKARKVEKNHTGKDR